jgi:polar amino acid transport system substrate-binding protein
LSAGAVGSYIGLQYLFPERTLISIEQFKKAMLRGGWLRRLSIIVAIAFLFWGGYRGCRWIAPKAPEVYKIGLDETWYPVSLYGNEHAFTAFSTDLLFAIARNQHMKVEIVRTGPKGLLDFLDDGKIDGALTSITPDDHGEDYYFSEPFYRFGAVLIVREDSDFQSLRNLPSARIGVKRNSSILYHISIDPSIIIVPYDSPLLILDDLIRDQVDGVIMDNLLAFLYFGGLYRDQVQVATLPLTIEGLRLITLQEAYGSKLIEMFNQGLKNLKEDGTYQRLLDQWGLYNPEKH